MRIGVNALFLIPNEVGGSETILRETLQAMVAMQPSVEFCLFTHQDNHDSLQNQFGKYPNVTFSKLSFHATNRYVRIIREQTELPIRAYQAKVDILWSPGYTAPLYAHCPQIVTILDMQYKRFPEDLNFLSRLVTHFLVISASRQCEIIITLSEFSKREIVQFLDVPPTKVAVSSCGVSPLFQSEHQKKIHPTVQSVLQSQKPYILCVANSYPHKDLPCLVSAFKRLLSQISHQLILVGQPRLGEPMLKRACEEIPNNRYRRVPFLSQQDLLPLYRRADVFVLPSRYEGFGLPILEAMSAGVPVLTTRCASIPEVGGDCVGYFQENNDQDLAHHLQVLLEMEPAERHAMIDQARRRAELFTWKLAAKEVLKCCEQVAKKDCLK
ncbi:MAG: hypothetical protein COV74_03250 [Candidatus Omnitrophica bacterium CG11_big_fil_rev_8_21_14_0_20_45_26]|uniref:Glycosyl transferase family 1 domain-containing protein n=1 Tax=Candidatus Abzuiibacterium crystallinum TaxID=1974748 RepID=A0A2H0LR78_9BACT|nr:MAG: hypothetical protein COV74_03250 [Candidatus Omnitrophica bacterium CG11_big_fil_rev_8_21_14_0_20_45_26]PIW64691.1 MAG: hypothetical protein COW12_05275 [Candidatus Omnitrophica bacterium CG12_big_fil_rev_8_21_14_0_65_45_16]